MGGRGGKGKGIGFPHLFNPTLTTGYSSVVKCALTDDGPVKSLKVFVRSLIKYWPILGLLLVAVCNIISIKLKDIPVPPGHHTPHVSLHYLVKY